jgi:hypothetical protein
MNGHLRLPILIASFALAVSSLAFAQGTKPAPKTAKPPAKTAPAPKSPAAPATAIPKPPPPPPPSDVRYKTTYVNADQTTDSTTFVRDTRERYELGDTILIKAVRPEENRADQQGRQYLPDHAGRRDRCRGGSRRGETGHPGAPGVVNVNVSIIDLAIARRRSTAKRGTSRR